MTKTKLVVLSVVLVAFAGAAFAQSNGSAAPGDARAACTAAMNADPAFAAAIVKTADDKAALARDEAVLATHKEAALRVQTNEKHVIYAYAAMWIVAAGFVIFLWRRQEALKSEIAGLRRELEAAADDSKSSPVRT